MAVLGFEKVADDVYVVLMGSVWNRLSQAVQDLANLQVAPPLLIDKAGGLMTISLGAVVGGTLVFPVHCTKDSGTMGSETTTCTATYHVKDIYDNELTDGANPTAILKTPELNQRIPTIQYTDNSPSAIGTAYYDKNQVLHLLHVNENPAGGVECADDAGSGS